MGQIVTNTVSKTKFLQILRKHKACKEGYKRAADFLTNHSVEQLINYYFKCDGKTHTDPRRYNFYTITYKRSCDLCWLARRVGAAFYARSVFTSLTK